MINNNKEAELKFILEKIFFPILYVCWTLVSFDCLKSTIDESMPLTPVTLPFTSSIMLADRPMRAPPSVASKNLSIKPLEIFITDEIYLIVVEL